jgi:hypothetical protein
LGLFDVLTAESVSFDDDTANVRQLVKRASLNRYFSRAEWEQLRFFALVKPNADILPVRTVYNEITQNIGNNYRISQTPIWFAGPDLIASVIRTGRAPEIIRAIRMVTHGKQKGNAKRKFARDG